MDSTKVKPYEVTCPHCYENQITKITLHIGMGTWVSFLIYGLMSACLCGWLVFVVPFYKDVEHHCSNCEQRIQYTEVA